MVERLTSVFMILIYFHLLYCMFGFCVSEGTIIETNNKSGQKKHEQIDLFVSGQDGYKVYRIPAVVVTLKGTILAFCEGRKYGPADYGDIDLIMKRSFDYGKTWEAIQIIWDDGEHTIGNPAPVVDHDTGTVWLLFCKNNDRVFVTKSRDDGVTWLTPVDITEDVKLPEWTWYATGPGHGIQLKSGRILIPCDHKEKGVIHSHVIYSDDHGERWKLGGILDKLTDESTCVELADGTVHINMRSYYKKRKSALSKDGGETWSKIKFEYDLVEPICQASIIRYTDKENHDKNRILFSNPASRVRKKMTIKLSYDEAQTWPVAKLLHNGPSGYSDLVVFPDMTVGILYECGENTHWEKITFTHFTLEWLTDGADSLDK